MGSAAKVTKLLIGSTLARQTPASPTVVIWSECLMSTLWQCQMNYRKLGILKAADVPKATEQLAKRQVNEGMMSRSSQIG